MIIAFQQVTLTWDPKTCFLTLLETHEVVCVAMTASIVENLALLRDRVVEIAFDLSSAGSFVHAKKARACSQNRHEDVRSNT